MPNPETDAQPRDELHIAAGSITVLRMLDIAYAIDLAKVESLWTAHTSASTSRARLNATPAKAMAFGDPPVALHLAPMPLDFGQGAMECSVTASFYAFGAVALAIGVPLRDMPWPQLLRLNHEIDRRIGPAGEATLWLSLLQGVVAIVGPALEKPSPTQLQEDYVIVLLSDLSEHLSAEALMARVDLAPLLSGEERELSESARQDLLRQKFSYYADDLVVLTWDRAFVYEPRGDSDVLDVLEVANAQLLELRYYDELLDAELPRMYDQVEGARHAIALLAARQFANLARRLYTLVAEVTELTEKPRLLARICIEVCKHPIQPLLPRPRL